MALQEKCLTLVGLFLGQYRDENAAGSLTEGRLDVKLFKSGSEG